MKTEDNTGTAVEDLVVWGYAENSDRKWMPYVLGIFTLGTFNLLLYWKPEMRLKLLYHRCVLPAAQRILIRDIYAQIYVEEIIRDGSKDLTYFEHKKVKYLWSHTERKFVQLRGLENTNCSDLHVLGSGLGTKDRQVRQGIYGPNAIEVQVKPVTHLIIYEALNPFYIFQMYTTIVWFSQLYWQFTLAVLLMSMVSIGVTVWETRRQSIILRDKVQSTSIVMVYKEDTGYVERMSDQLVPGDVIEVIHDTVMECDAVLLNGTVIINESMLTGESVPVSKMPVPRHEHDTYSPDSHKRHTLFCGTRVLQTHDPKGEIVKALVVRTGYATAKGELVRSILFPKPVDMKFYTDSMKFVVVSFCLGFIAMVYTAVTYTMNGTPPLEIIQSTFDILTFVVPPSLPACMTIANFLAQRRLKKIGIYCLSSKYINLAGNINVVAFDKTGTLTEDGLDLQGILPVQNGRFMETIRDGQDLEMNDTMLCMATCHSLAKIDGQISGDPLDLILFNSIQWDLHYGYHGDDECFSIPPNRIVRPKLNLQSKFVC